MYRAPLPLLVDHLRTALRSIRVRPVPPPLSPCPSPSFLDFRVVKHQGTDAPGRTAHTHAPQRKAEAAILARQLADLELCPRATSRTDDDDDGAAPGRECTPPGA